MRQPKGWHTQPALYSLLAAVSLALAGCGGSSSTPSSSPGPTPSTTENTQAIEVNMGPSSSFIYTNGLYTNVTICVPGTSNCQTIPDVLVDTGSEGLRLLSSVVTIQLPTISDNSSNTLQECVSFADGSYVWGPVAAADIQMAGEKASSVPIQLISASPQFPVPNQCTSSGGSNENTVDLLGANGILGIGVFQQDCGSACASTTSPGLYYLCPNGLCKGATVPVQYQLQNPVWMFPQDKNGVLITMPSVPADGAQTASGSLIFGIGTQSDNALGDAQVYTTDPYGNFHTIYSGVDYNQSYIDSGSNAIFFLDATTLSSAGIQDCQDNPGWYCPGSASSLSSVSFTVTNAGLNGTSNPLTFSIANTDYLFSANNGLNVAFDNLGGNSGTDTSSEFFDFGMPFFYGRNVFIGIENQAGPNGVIGPYWAY